MRPSTRRRTGPFIRKTYPLREVRVSVATICRTDIRSCGGRPPNPCPGILGGEIIGVTEEIAASIDKDMRGDTLRLGDRVTGEYFAGDGHYRDVHDLPQKCRACASTATISPRPIGILSAG